MINNNLLKFNGIWKLRLMFPELSDTQFQVLMYYSLGSHCENIADIMNCSVDAVKQSLQRIKKKFLLDKLDTVRLIYHTRAQTALMVADEFPQHYYETTGK